MSDNKQSDMFEILKGLQGDMSALRAGVTDLRTDMTHVKTRLERLETIATRQRRDSAAMLVMMRGTVGVFDERMKDIERDVRLLMALER